VVSRCPEVANSDVDILLLLESLSLRCSTFDYDLLFLVHYNIPGLPAVASIIGFADPSVAGFHAVDGKLFVAYPVFSESKQHQLKI
jgi:hypothetical protein